MTSSRIKFYNKKDGDLYEAVRKPVLDTIATLEEANLTYHVDYELANNTLYLYKQFMGNSDMNFAKAEFILDSDHSSFCWVSEDTTGRLVFNIKSRKQGYHNKYLIGNPYRDVI